MLLRAVGRYARLLLRSKMTQDTTIPSSETERIWHRLGRRVRRLVAARVRSAADVDDLVQTVFLRVHQKRGDLLDSDRLESWVFQIARNAVADHYRGRRTESLDEATVVASDREVDADNCNTVVAGWLPDLVERLPDDQRRATALYEFEGIPQQTIADRESISLSGAKSRIQRGRRKLAEMLQDCCRFQFDARGNVLDCEPRRQRCSVEADCTA